MIEIPAIVSPSTDHPLQNGVMFIHFSDSQNVILYPYLSLPIFIILKGLLYSRSFFLNAF